MNLNYLDRFIELLEVEEKYIDFVKRMFTLAASKEKENQRWILDILRVSSYSNRISLLFTNDEIKQLNIPDSIRSFLVGWNYDEEFSEFDGDTITFLEEGYGIELDTEIVEEECYDCVEYFKLIEEELYNKGYTAIHISDSSLICFTICKNEYASEFPEVFHSLFELNYDEEWEKTIHGEIGVYASLA